MDIIQIKRQNIAQCTILNVRIRALQLFLISDFRKQVIKVRDAVKILQTIQFIHHQAKLIVAETGKFLAHRPPGTRTIHHSKRRKSHTVSYGFAASQNHRSLIKRYIDRAGLGKKKISHRLKRKQIQSLLLHPVERDIIVGKTDLHCLSIAVIRPFFIALQKEFIPSFIHCKG